MSEENKASGDAGGTGGDAHDLEDLKARLEAAEKRAKEYEGKFEMTKAERSEEREKRQREAEKNQQYEEAKSLLEAKLSEKEAELEKLQTSLQEYEPLKTKAEQWEQYETSRRESLLSKIPESQREAFTDASLQVLEATVATIADRGGVHKGGSAPLPSGSKKWSEMSMSERDEWTAANMNEPNFRSLQQQKIKEG